MIPVPVVQAPAAADTIPLPSTWRHLEEPVPAEETTSEVVEAKIPFWAQIGDVVAAVIWL